MSRLPTMLIYLLNYPRPPLRHVRRCGPGLKERAPLPVENRRAFSASLAAGFLEGYGLTRGGAGGFALIGSRECEKIWLRGPLTHSRREREHPGRRGRRLPAGEGGISVVQARTSCSADYRNAADTAEAAPGGLAAHG